MDIDFPDMPFEGSRTFVERLRMSLRQPVTVYVMSVHPGMSGVPGGGIGMGGGTLLIQGMLVFVGADYIDVHVTGATGTVRQVLIPIGAIGAIIPATVM